MNKGHYVNLDKTGTITDFTIGDDYSINVKTSTVVKMTEFFTVVTDKGPITLPVEVTSDFNQIPEEYHEVFLNVLTSKYMNKVNFGTNPFSECKPYEKRKWWQFWRI